MKPAWMPLLALVVAGGIAILGWETEGFRVVTSEGARRIAVERAPVLIPDVVLLDQNGTAFSLSDYRGKTVLFEFIYTHCPTVCGLLGDDFRHVLALEPRVAGRDIALLSIAFDLERDDREARALYAERYGATPPRWRIAAPISRGDLETLRRSFGVVIIPDGNGGFVHGDDVYVVDARGRLVRVFDADTPQQLVVAAIRTAP